MKITRRESYQIQRCWTFLGIHPDGGLTGLGSPIVESWGRTVIAAVREIAPHLLGKDPRRHYPAA